MLPEPRLLVFDLDGTLIDSRIDLTNCVNATLAHFGKPQLESAVIAGYIGDGASTLVRRALAHSYRVAGDADPHGEAFVEQALDWFLDYYRIHKLDYTTVYPGVLDALTAIRSRHPHLPMAVLTNKPVNPSRDLCAHLGLAPFFFANYGGNSFPTKKPEPTGLLTLIAEASELHPARPPIAPAETVMIGDSHFDIETAKNAGTRSLGCTFGLSPETLAAANPDLTVDHASEWPHALGL
jgi:phosphoglycolate phosphatase